MDPEEIQGVDPTQLEEAAAAMEALIAAALLAVAAQAATEILIPGVPLVDIDALSVIPTLWTVRAERDLIPHLELTIRIVAQTLRDEIDEALPLEFPLVPEILDTTAAQILSGARNRLVGIGDILWNNARTSLVEGVELGEDVPSLAARVRAAAEVTVPRSRTIARTEVISASNAASIAQARSAGVEMEKGWLATEDERTRPAHAIADGQWVPLDGMFDVGGELLDFPGDPEGRADNVINERCAIIYRLTGMTPTVAAADRNYVRDDGQFADVPGLGGDAPEVLEAGELPRLISYNAEDYENDFGGVEDEFLFLDDGAGVRLFEDGTAHIVNQFGEGEDTGFQPMTLPLTSSDLYDMEDALRQAIEFDPDDARNPDGTLVEDQLGAIDEFDGGGLRFAPYGNGDIQVRLPEALHGWEVDQSEQHAWDLSADEAEEFRQILEDAASALVDIEESLEEDEDDDVVTAAAVPHLYACTKGVKVNGRWPPGPCKGWKDELPGGDPRKVAPKSPRKPRAAAAPRKRALAPNDPGITEGMNPAQRGAAEQVVVDRARTRGEMLAALSELVENDAPADVLAHRAGSLKRSLGDGADAAADKVIAAAGSGDKAKMRRAVKAAAKKWGLDQVGTYGKPVAFDPKVHRTFGGGASVRPEDGEAVVLDRPGFTFRDHQGNDLNLVKAVVSRPIPAPDTPDTRADAARARQAKIDAARSRANVLAEIEELLLNEEEPELIERNVRKLAERLKVQDDPAVAAVLAAAGGDRDALLQKVREAAGTFGLRRVGAPRQPFDPRQHQAIGGRPREGALVDLVRPGYTATVDGEQVLVEKAVVEKAEPGEPVRGGTPVGKPTLGGLIARQKPSDAQTVAQAQAIYGGTFAGLTAEVTEATPVHIGGKSLIVAGDIKDAKGNRVGTFTRSISDRDGELTASHSSLNLSPKVRGQGFAEGFNSNAISWYRDNGVKEVHLFTSDVGGYAWARAGYDWANPAGAEGVFDRVKVAAMPSDIDISVDGSAIPDDRLEAQRQLARDLVRRIETAGEFGTIGYPTPYEISQLGRWAGAGKDDMWIGKAIMLDSSWAGVRYL